MGWRRSSERQGNTTRLILLLTEEPVVRLAKEGHVISDKLTLWNERETATNIAKALAVPSASPFLGSPSPFFVADVRHYLP
jgi:hypothetical protein